MTAERIAAMPDDDWRKHDPRFQEPQLSRHLALVARLQEVAERHDTTAGAIAVAWTLHHPAVHGLDRRSSLPAPTRSTRSRAPGTWS